MDVERRGGGFVVMKCVDFCLGVGKRIGGRSIKGSNLEYIFDFLGFCYMFLFRIGEYFLVFFKISFLFL